VLQVRDVSKSYGSKQVLRDVSFVVNAGGGWPC
jgi:ABC-type multidrug transport system ATPase subunit